ncbi:MAG: toll/interleukin-1 receptor domain-containing protein [Solobacterium sp.]|nr:toll/interleukin-1 receptor domain-containing protein [Solobacterium sp.]
MSADVFISYKSDEEEYARKIRSVLEQNGISCWMAPDSIPVGSNYMKQIPLAIDGCRAMIVLISEKSQNSVWVKNEFSQAVTKNKLIIPYVIQDCPLQDEFAFSMSTMQQLYAYRDEQAALTKLVHDIRDALGKENGPRVQINITPPAKKPNPLIYVLAGLGVIAAVLAAFFLLAKPAGNPAGTNAEPVSVYYSEVIPYALAGRYATPQEAIDDRFEFPEYEKAVSLLSFIRNDGDKPVFAEKISAGILNCSLTETPVLRADGVLEGDVISAYVFNDGWGAAEEIHASWHTLRSEDVPEFPSFEQAVQGEKTLFADPGSAAEIFRTQFDREELLAWARSQEPAFIGTIYTIAANLTCGKSEASLFMFLGYDAETDDLYLEFGGASDEKPSITLFALLDVDNPPEELRFYTGDDIPYVEHLYRIETVIIPTKSCSLSFLGRYQIDGKEYATEENSVSVSVPHFEEQAIQLSGRLTRELSSVNMNDKAAVEEACRKYWYRPESLIPAEG